MKSTVHHTYSYSLTDVECGDTFGAECLLAYIADDMDKRYIDELVSPTTGEVITKDMIKQAMGVLNGIRTHDDQVWNVM